MSYCNLEMKTTKKMITVLLIILTLIVATPVACYMIVKHSTRERMSGTPPIIKWLMPPVRAVNAIMNTLVPTARCMG